MLTLRMLRAAGCRCFVRHVSVKPLDNAARRQILRVMLQAGYGVLTPCRDDRVRVTVGEYALRTRFTHMLWYGIALMLCLCLWHHATW